jgi:hypothetical protein
MNWFWLNIPLGVAFFLAIAGIPLWMVIRHPDHRPAAADATSTGTTAQPRTVTVADMTGRPAVAAEICDRRELVGASAGDRG